MVKIRAFRGFLANQTHCSRVIAPAYDTLNTKEALAMAGDNEMSFLRVNKPEINLSADTNQYD